MDRNKKSAHTTPFRRYIYTCISNRNQIGFYNHCATLQVEISGEVKIVCGNLAIPKRWISFLFQPALED